MLCRPGRYADRRSIRAGRRADRAQPVGIIAPLVRVWRCCCGAFIGPIDGGAAMGKDVMRLAGEPSRIPVSGELSPVVEDFRRVLAEGGFNRHTVATHTHLIADLSRWLTGRGLTAAQFTVDELPVFLADRRSAGRTALVSARGAAPMMAFLRERGLIPAASLPSPTGPVG